MPRSIARAYLATAGIQGLLEGERRSLTVRELDQHRSSKRQEGLGWIPVEDGLCLVGGPVRSDCGVEGRLSSVFELVSERSRWEILQWRNLN